MSLSLLDQWHLIGLRTGRDLPDTSSFSGAKFRYLEWLARDLATTEEIDDAAYITEYGGKVHGSGDLGGVLRSRERAEEWQKAMAFYGERESKVAKALSACFWRRCSVRDASVVIEAAAAELLAELPPEPPQPLEYSIVLERSNRKTTPRHRPAITHSALVIRKEWREEIDRAALPDRWHVALRVLLAAAIHVVLKFRSAYDTVRVARELVGDLFPGGQVDDDLAKLAGVKLSRLSDKPRGGHGRRSIGAVVEELRKKYAPSDINLVRAALAADPKAGNEAIAKLLGMRRQRVDSARRELEGVPIRTRSRRP